MVSVQRFPAAVVFWGRHGQGTGRQHTWGWNSGERPCRLFAQDFQPSMWSAKDISTSHLLRCREMSSEAGQVFTGSERTNYGEHTFTPEMWPTYLYIRGTPRTTEGGSLNER